METRAVFFLMLFLVGCSGTPVGKVAQWESDFTDFWSTEKHRAMVIHPHGCYVAWDEPSSDLEAERRALLMCKNANRDSDVRCTVIATDERVCPIKLSRWVETQGQLDVGLTRDRIRNTIYGGEGDAPCELGPALEVRSPPGTEPPPVESLTAVPAQDVAAFFGLEDYDLGSSEFVTNRAPYYVARGLTAEALHFVERKDGKQTCVLRAFSQWDPRNRELDTLFTVHFLGCFEM